MQTGGAVPSNTSTVALLTLVVGAWPPVRIPIAADIGKMLLLPLFKVTFVLIAVDHGFTAPCFC